MAVNRQRALEIVRRRQQVSELCLQGWTQSAIAERLKVTQATISGDLKKIREAWLKATIRNFEEARAIELQRLDRIEREAWAAWERSQKPAVSAVMHGEGNARPTRQSVKDQHGDPRYLELVNKCIAARRAILGLDAPQKVLPADAEGRGLNVADLVGLAAWTVAARPRANVIDVQTELARDGVPPPGPCSLPLASPTEVHDETHPA